MMLKLLKSKIHRAKVTDSHIDYPGSIGIDSDLLKAAGILPYEAVLVADINNGQRVETYVVPEAAGSGRGRVLGAAARLIKKGDIVIILNFAYYTPQEAQNHKGIVVIPDEHNGVKEIL